MQIKKILLILSLCFAPLLESNQALFDAVKKNDDQKVREILESNDPSVNINFQNLQYNDNYPYMINKNTPLIIACKNNNHKMVQLLLEKDANPNFQNNVGDTALMIVCMHGYTQIAELLIANTKTKLNITNNQGDTALMLACYNQYPKIAQLLIDNLNTDLNIKGFNGKTALIIACEKNNIQIAQLLIENHKTDLNIREYKGDMTALMIACHEKYEEIAKLLIENHKTDLNLQSSFQYTALMYAAMTNLPTIVKLLLQNNADPNIPNSNGYTALMFACSGNYHTLAALLIANPTTNLNLQNNSGYTALMLACSSNHHTLAALLVLAGADETNVTNPRHQTVLNQPIITFARNLRQWIAPAPNTTRDQSPDHQKIQQVFNSVLFKNPEFCQLRSFLQETDPEVILSSSLAKMLGLTKQYFAIKDFDNIYAEYQKLTAQ